MNPKMQVPSILFQSLLSIIIKVHIIYINFPDLFHFLIAGSLSASQTTDTSSIKTKHSPLHTPIGSTFDWETDGEDAGDLGYNDSKLKKKTTTTVKKTKFNGCILWFR